MIPYRKIIDRKTAQVRATLAALDDLDIQNNNLKLGRNILEDWGRLIIAMLGKLRAEEHIPLFEFSRRRAYRSHIGQELAFVERNLDRFFEASSGEKFEKIFRGTE